VTHSTAVLSQLLNELYAQSPKIIKDFKNVEQWSFSANYISAGSDPTKSVIPGKAEAMISYRFSGGTSSDAIISALNKYFDSKSRETGTRISFTTKVTCEAIETDKTNWLLDTCIQNLKKIELEHFTGRMQGSLPVASIIKDIYQTDPLIIAFGSKDSNTHGANEFMRVENIEKSMLFFEKFFTDQS
jgi:acetylornithine deacetylase/succinyl-diaminopimelate desuccinylase-like protein